MAAPPNSPCVPRIPSSAAAVPATSSRSSSSGTAPAGPPAFLASMQMAWARRETASKADGSSFSTCAVYTHLATAAIRRVARLLPLRLVIPVPCRAAGQGMAVELACTAACTAVGLAIAHPDNANWGRSTRGELAADTGSVPATRARARVTGASSRHRFKWSGRT